MVNLALSWARFFREACASREFLWNNSIKFKTRNTYYIHKLASLLHTSSEKLMSLDIQTNIFPHSGLKYS